MTIFLPLIFLPASSVGKGSIVNPEWRSAIAAAPCAARVSRIVRNDTAGRSTTVVRMADTNGRQPRRPNTLLRRVHLGRKHDCVA